MKKIYITLTFISVFYLATMYYLGNNAKSDVLGVNENPTIETSTPNSIDLVSPTTSPSAQPSHLPIPTSTPSPTIKPTITPSTTPTPTPIPTPGAASSSDINSFIDRFAGQYGVDPNVLRYIALCESWFRSNAENAGYVGLYQFGETTWKNIRLEIGEDTDPDLRYSAEESVQTAAYALSKGKESIWPNCIP
jgi:hypothetical protein